ncbi:YfhO family protein [Flavitalea sp. BT771]|uniref:YfhO family protein n=1 Tax=Flavitalea sp. BT771 TaxID=3063329 RepID=UPI0026E38921|nr:YfhO family protein [Flavitalea sp. BT771]MDO6433920.1 YfhO family protein [Flavitalea sp. BT771]MDV6222175.1 YfhO family protein [Flavitalea sp. BT771]
MLKHRFIQVSGLHFPGKKWFTRLLPHGVAVLIFLLVAVIYCKPVFQGKVLFQEDLLQWKAMAQQSFQFRQTHGHFPLWSNSMFCGMPAYQIAMDGPSLHLSSVLYGMLTLYLEKPASFFFLACICFYFLAGVLRVNPFIGIIGSLAYAYATYNPVIVAVGHDTKMQCIAMLPGLIGSMILVLEKRYWQGMALMALFASMMISTGHMQIVYYTFLAAMFLFGAYAIRWIRGKEFRRLRHASLVCIGAVLVGVLANGIVLFTTNDSSHETIRGGSELADHQSNYTSNGLSETAAFDFSMYRTEPFVLLVPDIYGGSTDLQLPAEKSHAVQALQKMPAELGQLVGEDGPRYYWGGVGDLLAGPPYAGAIICFLALAGLIMLDKKHKWWILSAFIVTIVMSWGSYFQPFNSWLLKYLPMYNKFRAPSMIIVIPNFLLCLLATLTLQRIYTWGISRGNAGTAMPVPEQVRRDSKQIWQKYRWGLLLTLAVFGVLFGLYAGSNYTGLSDIRLLEKAAAKGKVQVGYVTTFLEGLRLDRRTLFLNSILRSLSFVAAAALILALYLKRKVRPAFLLASIGLLSFVDLMDIDLKYLNYDNYQEKEEYQTNFIPTESDKEVMQDKGYYRVFDLRDTANNTLSYGAMTAYFHNSIGGYHAAKLRVYEDLIVHQLMNYPICQPVINMLNTKYILRRSVTGKEFVYQNANCLGPVWFVDSIRFLRTPKTVMDTLTHFQPAQEAIVFTADKDKVAYVPGPDTTAQIHLLNNDNDVITYVSTSKKPRFAVFSEVFYGRGWKAWVDDREVPIIRTNYALRGLSIPPGRHVIRFVFHPLSYYIGRQVQWMAIILQLLLVAGAVIVSLYEKGLRIRIAGRPVLNFHPESLPSS